MPKPFSKLLLNVQTFQLFIFDKKVKVNLLNGFLHAFSLPDSSRSTWFLTWQKSENYFKTCVVTWRVCVYINHARRELSEVALNVVLLLLKGKKTRKTLLLYWSWFRLHCSLRQHLGSYVESIRPTTQLWGHFLFVKRSRRWCTLSFSAKNPTAEKYAAKCCKILYCGKLKYSKIPQRLKKMLRNFS